MRFALVGADGLIVNVIVWDGVTWFPPATASTSELLTVPTDDAPAEPGGRYRATGTPRWTRKPEPPQPPVPPGRPRPETSP